jgi:hypothetical protein
LIFSPANMASRLPGTPRSRARSSQQLQRAVVEAVLRIIEEQAGGFERHRLEAARLRGEQVAQGQAGW